MALAPSGKSVAPSRAYPLRRDRFLVNSTASEAQDFIEGTAGINLKLNDYGLEVHWVKKTNGIRWFRQQPIEKRPLEVGYARIKILVSVWLVFVMIQVRLQYFVRNVAHIPRTGPNASEMTAPTPPLQLRKFFQQ